MSLFNSYSLWIIDLGSIDQANKNWEVHKKYHQIPMRMRWLMYVTTKKKKKE